MGLLTENGFRFKRVLVGSFVCHAEELITLREFKCVQWHCAPTFLI
jgi:hypothetical protein